MGQISKLEQTIRRELAEQVQDDEFAQQLYASLCNTVWYNEETGEKYSCSWRYAGGVVASMRCQGEDYIHFYCSGGEGNVQPLAYKALNELGYVAIDDDED